ncbi:hypothetical protein [Haloferula sargassicola]|uniref:Verru_Chthon cassette protein A n=1 Tax=Haloferula sargassicola TaxID=490096 RepID=A0ABP9UQ72_9BACT
MVDSLSAPSGLRNLPTRRKQRQVPAGFALVVVTLMMVLMSLLAIGLLSLGSVVSRGSRQAESRKVADANARMALMLALNDLQKTLGDDRRITADASLLMGSGTSSRPAAGSAAVGVWESDYSDISENRSGDPPDYSTRRDNNFIQWLVSAPNREVVEDMDYDPSGSSASDPALLFSENLDGFNLQADKVLIGDVNDESGAYAWAVTQNATKAQINVGGDRKRTRNNDGIEAPTRPNLGLSDVMQQPTNGWDTRRARVLSMSQAVLDPAYGLDSSKQGIGSFSYTTSSYGVQADVTRGGLRKDLSLGFELDDSDFTRATLNGVDNPFASQSGPDGERPIFEPITDGSPISIDYAYRVASYTDIYKTGAPPTFNSLRSHYRAYKHLYQSNGDVTAKMRPVDSAYYNDNAPRGTETGIQPVLDRLVMSLNMSIIGGKLYFLITPVITLWNPYNVAIETDGLVAYPWMDVPLFLKWQINGQDANGGAHLSTYIGGKYRGQGEGRQETPFFYFALTQKGDGDTTTPVHLAPGEVRVFKPASNDPVMFTPLAASEAAKFQALTCQMKPAGGSLDSAGGIAVSMAGSFNDGANIKTSFTGRETIGVELRFEVAGDYHYFVSVEDAGRLNGSAQSQWNKVLDAQVHAGTQNNFTFRSPSYPARGLMRAPQMVGALEVYHRTASQGGADRPSSDIVYTVNPQQRYVTGALSGMDTRATGLSPHYESTMRQAADFLALNFQTTPDGTRSYYGETNAPPAGRDHLSFFGIPEQPPLSMGSFQHANIMDTAFGPANSIGNSWASPYVSRNSVRTLLRTASTGERIKPRGLGIYDGSYLINNALWDQYFLSSIGPEVTPGNSPGSGNPWNQTVARVRRDVDEVVKDWVENPLTQPLRNSRNTLYEGDFNDEEVISRLTDKSGFAAAAAHILTEGSFNVNSTNVDAWEAILASLRGETIDFVGGGSEDASRTNPLIRLSPPTGEANDRWDGYRELSDSQIKSLAESIVDEVRARGPFFSLADFVNRRLTNDDQGLKGALQAAIDNAGLNQQASVASFSPAGYPERRNIPDPDTGIGTPGWLTQADVLTSIAPVISVRSDTFTIRAYGEAFGKNQQVEARSCCEAVVQRVPEWVDPTDKPEADIDEITRVNENFGRRFKIVSIRQIPLDLLKS